MERIEMSGKEVKRLEVLRQVADSVISQRSAGQLLGLSERQVRRLQRRYESKGAMGLIKAGLWQPAKGRRQRLHPPRPRRSRRGELVQIDGSPHDWFEGRGPRCTLIAFIDDATSRQSATWVLRASRH